MRRIAVFAVLYYLRLLARLALGMHKPYIIGIAGSVGKSSTRNALYAVLHKHFPTKMVGNSETGIPLGILGIVPSNYSKAAWIAMLFRAPFGLFNLRGTKYLIVEMGIDDPYPPKNMSFLITIVKPQIAIELNVATGNTTPAHAMQFEKLLKGSQNLDKHEFLLEKMAEEDTKIITKSHAEVGIYNIDDLYVQQIMVEYDRNHPGAQLLTFGESRENDISYGPYKIDLDGSSFSFSIKQGSRNKKVALTIKDVLLPKEYREIFAATLLVALHIGLEPEQVVAALEKQYQLPKGRASMFAGIYNSVIIDSSYNAARASVIAFLDMVKILKRQTKQDVVMLFGDMRELGSESETEHREVAKYMEGIVDYLYLVGPQTKEYVYPYFEHKRLKELRWFDNSREAGLYLKNNLPEKSIVLVKGSQNTIFLEEAIKFVLKDKTDEKKLCRQDEHFLQVKLAMYGS